MHDRTGTRFTGQPHHADRPRGTGAVTGPVTAEQAGQLLNRLRASDDPGRTAQDLPWAAAVARADGTLAVTVSTSWTAGLFWSGHRWPEGWRFVTGTDALAVARATGGPAGIDDDFLRRFVAGGGATTRTPFRGVHRLPTGVTLVLDPRTGTTRETEWCGPATLPPPALRGEGVAARYRDTFDEAVRGLTRVAGPLVTSVSGGLDSTFLAASLVAARPDGPVHAFCHRPLPEANVRPQGGFDPDDFPYAGLMARRYPGALLVEPLLNEELVHPLDAAAAAFRAGGWPVHGIPDAWWENAVADRAAGAGSRFVFAGTRGDAAFSHEHGYAAAHYLGRGRVVAAAVEAARSPRAATRALLAPAEPAGRGAGVASSGGPVIRPAFGPPVHRDGRSGFLFRLTGRHPAQVPGGGMRQPGIMTADPYSCRSVIELAAAIEPAEWRRGPWPQALARRLGEGRVPDPIRFRTRRGAPDGDCWYVVRNLPGRLRADVEQVLEDPAFAAAVERPGLRDWLDVALRTPSTAPPPPGLAVVLRLMSAAQYARWAKAELSVPAHIDMTRGEPESNASTSGEPASGELASTRPHAR